MFQQLSTAKQYEWIDRLFARLGAMYGSKFKSMWEGQDIAGVKSVWMEDLAEFSPDEIKAGVSACKTREWPPTLPEFIRLCRPSIDYERAYYDAMEQLSRRNRKEPESWPYAALYWATVGISYDLLNRPYVDMKKRWAKAMDDSLLAVRNGERPNVVPANLAALPEPGKSTIDAETMRKNVDHLKEMIGGFAKSKAIPEQ